MNVKNKIKDAIEVNAMSVFAESLDQCWRHYLILSKFYFTHLYVKFKLFHFVNNFAVFYSSRLKVVFSYQNT